MGSTFLQSAVVLSPKIPFTREFVFCHCRSQDFMDRFIGNAIGTSTSHQRVKPNDLMNLPAILPNRDVIKNFSEIVSPIFKHIMYLRMRNSHLRRTRDLLLPKLVSGEIDVSSRGEDSAQEFVEAHVSPAMSAHNVPERVEPINTEGLVKRSLWE